jgi:hypothetical protein
MNVTPLYHVGFVVKDIDAAMAAWSEATGIRFGAILTRTLTWGSPADDGALAIQEVETKFSCSINGPPYIELIQRRDGKPWEHLGFHHIGMWSNDIASDSDRLAALGCPWAGASLDPVTLGKVGGCFHTVIDGARVELVSRARGRARPARYLGGAGDVVSGWDHREQGDGDG